MPLLPGFGRPLTYVPQPGDSNYIGGVFPSALYDVFTESRFDYGDGRAAYGSHLMLWTDVNLTFTAKH